MNKKCVLIVDDSRTARQVLERRLTAFEIDVVTVGSAVNAIDYLYGNTPDAVFMDYEMPGMDGFQALKIIKSNPETAMIPVMMYTSKAGDIALSEARALGAIGVLPKEMEAQDLDSVIEKLHLLPTQQSLVKSLKAEDRGSETPTGFHGEAASADNVTYLDESDFQRDKVEYPTETYDESVFLLKRQSRIFQKQLESVENKLLDSIGKALTVLRDEFYEAKAQREGMLEVPRRSLRWILLANLLVVLLVGYLVWRQIEMPVGERAERIVGVESELSDLKQQVWHLEASVKESNNASSDMPSSTEAEAALVARNEIDLLTWAANRGTEFRYGENPFDDVRVAWLSELVNQLHMAGFEGTINLKANYASFCLSKSETGGLVLAKEQMPFDDCLFSTAAGAKDFTQSSYQTLGFANYLNSLSAEDALAIEIFVESDEHGDPVAAYPESYAVKTAGEWNRIAGQNQRI
ncbi:MAG: response regulator, partial [Pseudomonadota bacterium]